MRMVRAQERKTTATKHFKTNNAVQFEKEQYKGYQT